MLEAGHRIRGEPAMPLGLAATPLDARGVLRHLRAGAGLVLLCGLLGVFAVNGALSLITPQYTSSIQILLDPGGLHVVDGDIFERRAPSDSGAFLAENQAQVVRSDSVLRRVVSRLDLANDPEFAAPGWGERLFAPVGWALGIGPVERPDPIGTALDTLRRKVTSNRPERTLVVYVFVETSDPQKSVRIADAVGDAYFEEEAANRTGAAQRLSKSFDRGLPGLKAAIADVESRILRYRQDHDLVTSDGATLGDRQLGTLNRQAAAASIRTAEARERLDQAKRARPDDAGAALPEMLRSRELSGLRQQYATLSRGTAELTARLGARHPALGERAAQERDLRAQIQREKERVVDGLQKEFDRAVASEAAIRAGLSTARDEVADNGRAEVGLRELNRELAARTAVYEAQMRRSREIGEQGLIDTGRIRIISPAKPPPLRSWPPSSRVVVMPQAAVLGLVVGAGLALALGRWRERRRSARMLLHGDVEGARAEA